MESAKIASAIRQNMKTPTSSAFASD